MFPKADLPWTDDLASQKRLGKPFEEGSVSAVFRFTHCGTFSHSLGEVAPEAGVQARHATPSPDNQGRYSWEWPNRCGKAGEKGEHPSYGRRQDVHCVTVVRDGKKKLGPPSVLMMEKGEIWPPGLDSKTKPTLR